MFVRWQSHIQTRKDGLGLHPSFHSRLLAFISGSFFLGGDLGLPGALDIQAALRLILTGYS